MKDKATLGKFIQSKRKENGLSQKELAEKLFVTESAVSKWERGVSYPDITMISGICETLNISEHELCTASEDHRQRELEKTARSYKTFIRIWNISLFTLYAAILIPLFIVGVIINGNVREYFMTFTGFLVAASLLNIPTLVKKRTGLVTYLCAFVTLNLTLLQMCFYAGGGWKWYLSLLLNLLFISSAVILPLFLKYAPAGLLLRRHKLLTCITADSLLLILCVGYSEWRVYRDLFWNDKFFNVLVLVILVMIFFLVIRYTKISGFFKASICSGVLAVIAAPYKVINTSINEWLFSFGECIAASKEYFIASAVFAAASAVLFVIGAVQYLRNRKCTSRKAVKGDNS